MLHYEQTACCSYEVQLMSPPWCMPRSRGGRWKVSSWIRVRQNISTISYPNPRLIASKLNCLWLCFFFLIQSNSKWELDECHQSKVWDLVPVFEEGGSDREQINQRWAQVDSIELDCIWTVCSTLLGKHFCVCVLMQWSNPWWWWWVGGFF